MSLDEGDCKSGVSENRPTFEEIYQRIFSRVENWLKKYPDKSIETIDILQHIALNRLEEAGNGGLRKYADDGEEESLWNSLKNSIRNKFRKPKSKTQRCIPPDKLTYTSDLESEMVVLESKLVVHPMEQHYLENREKIHQQAKFLNDSDKFSAKELVLLNLICVEQIRNNRDLLDEMRKEFPELTPENLRQLRSRLRNKLEKFPIADEKSTKKNKREVE